MKRSLSTAKFFISILTASVLLTGCLSAIHPLPERDRASEDSPLVGHWHGVVTNAMQQNKIQFWSVFYFGGNHYSVVMSTQKAYPKEDFDLARPDEDTSVFDMTASTIGGKTYLSLKGIRGTDIRDYLIVKYELSGDQLSVYNISDAAIKRGIASKQLRARKNDVVTSGPRGMAKWIQTLTDGDYEPYATFERSKLGARQLTHHVLSVIPQEA